MDWWHLIDTSRVLVFTLVLTRVSALVIMAPVMHTTDAPVQFRALLAFAFTLTIMPSQWFVEVVEPEGIFGYVIMLAAELLIGLAMGLAFYILFAGVALAGELIGQVGGLMASQIFDPVSGDQVPLMSRAFQFFAITVFVLIGGLNVLVCSLLDTFSTIPIGTLGFQPDVAYALVIILNTSFDLALRVAAPTLVATLISMFVVGLLGKTLPQLNLMSVGFGINSMVMFIFASFTAGVGMWAFQEEIGGVFETLFAGLHATIETGIAP